MHRSNSHCCKACPHDTPLSPTPPPPICNPCPPPDGPPPPPGPPKTIIYIQNFATPRTKPTHETSWSTGICGCCSDMNTCIVPQSFSPKFAAINLLCFLIIFLVTVGLVTAACPCITAGRIAEIVNEGKTCKLMLIITKKKKKPFVCLMFIT